MANTKEYFDTSATNENICYCYGNCQADVLCLLLKEHPLLRDKYTFNHFFVGNSITTIDINLLYKTEIFIYQYVKDTTLKNDDNPDLDRKLYTAEYIMENYLPKTCACISFSSIYFNAYWPCSGSGYLLDEHRKFSIDFPHFYIQDKLYELVQNLNLSENDILEKINDDHFICNNDIQSFFESTCKDLKAREIYNDVDISVSDYLIENFKKKRMMNTLNHPTIDVYDYLINKINEQLQLPATDYVLKNQKFTKIIDNIYKIPIFACVTKHYDLNDSTFDSPFYILDKQFLSRDDFYLYFIRKIRS